MDERVDLGTVNTQDWIAACNVIMELMKMVRDDDLTAEDLGRRVRAMFYSTPSRPN